MLADIAVPSICPTGALAWYHDDNKSLGPAGGAPRQKRDRLTSIWATLTDFDEDAALTLNVMRYALCAMCYVLCAINR